MTNLPGTSADAVREWGHTYVDRGWAVFKLRSDSKLPLAMCDRCRAADHTHDREACRCLTCHGFYAATKDHARWDQMCDAYPDGWVAVRTGWASGVFVIDADVKIDRGQTHSGVEVVDTHWDSYANFDLPFTRIQKTRSGGRHLFYALPRDLDVRSVPRALPGVDVKGNGGYVVVHPSPGYEWINPEQGLSIPLGRFRDWLRTTKGFYGGVGDGAGGPLPSGFDLSDAEKNGCPAGARDPFFNTVIYKLRRGNVPFEIAESVLYDHWERCEQPAGDEFKWDWVRYKLERVYQTVEPEVPEGWRPWSVNTLGDDVEEDEDDGDVERAGADPGLPGDGDDDGDRGDQPGPADPEAGGQARTSRRGRTRILNLPDFGRELTQTGLAHRYVRLFQDKALFVPGVGWHVWDEISWVSDELNDTFDMTQMVLAELHTEAEDAAGDDELQQRLTSFYRSSSTMSTRRAILEGAAADRRMKRLARDLDADPMLIVCQNGTFDAREWRFRDSEERDYSTHSTNVNWDPDAACPRWLEHVRLVCRNVDNERDPMMEAYLRRWAGYCLTGLTQEQKFAFLYGEGKNGKNVFIETLVGMMGSYAMLGSVQLLIGTGQEHETILADLAGKRLAFIDETPKGRINESRLKQLSGTGTIRARYMRQDTFEFPATFKIVIAGNNRPRVSDTSEGFWRRLDLVPFDSVIPEQRRVRDYVRVLEAEWPGILNWALEGLRDYLENGLGEPQRVAEAVEDYREEENVFGQFVRDCFNTESTQRSWIPNNVLESVWNLWSMQHGDLRPVKMQRLTSDWKRAGFKREPKTRRIWQDNRSQVQRGWVGYPLAVNIPDSLRWQDD